MLGLSKERHKGQKSLSREELEINEVLASPASGSKKSASEKTSPAHPSKTTKEGPQPKVLSMDDLSSLISESVVKGVKEGFACARQKRKRTASQRESSSGISSPKLIQADADLPGVDPVQKGTVPPVEVFGSDINETFESSDEEDQDREFSSPVPSHRNPSPSVPPAHVSGSSSIPKKVNPSTDKVEEEPDVDLPSGNSRLPASWFPKPKVFAWLEKVADNEMSADDRKQLIEKYHPLENYDHLLSPVKMPKKLYQAVKSYSTKKKDYLFNRSSAEKELFFASSDLCASLRPFIEAISQLDDIPGATSIKALVGKGVLGVLSANLRISRGRREISRRCVKLDCANALFNVNPTHKSIFGNSSDIEAVKAAKETSKVDDSYVFNPPKIKKTQYLSQPADQYKGKSQFFQNPYYEYPYKFSERKYPQNQKGKGRGRGQRGRGQKKSAKPAYTKE